MKKMFIVVTLILLILLVAIPILARPWESRNGDDMIAKDQVIGGDFFFHGSRLVIDGIVRGDLLVVADEVVINGTVEGSVIGLVGEKLSINGVINGNLRTLANELTLNGKVGRNLSIGALRFFAEPQAEVGGGILGLFSEAKLNGNIKGDTEFRSFNATQIGAKIGGDLLIHGVAPDWSGNTKVTGKVLDYSVGSKDPRKIKGFSAGDYQQREEDANINLFQTLLWVSLVWFIGSVLLSLVFYTLFPRTAWAMSDPAPLNFRKNILVGSIGLITVPIAIIILIYTVVGIPVAILMGLFYLVLILFSGVPINLWVGRLLFQSRLKPVWLIVTGSIFTLVVGLIPLLGFMVELLLSVVGCGMIFRLVKPQFKARNNIEVQA